MKIMNLKKIIFIIIWLLSTPIFASSILLISIDGYRHDYNEIYSPPFLRSFEKGAARVKSLIPSFPTKTYPNHLSLVTGRYPMNHGIVSNHFYEPEIKRIYKLKDRSSVKDPRFYKAPPIWNLVEQNGLKSAPYFWPGSETPINGIRPTYWEEYNHNATHEEKITKVAKYLFLPKEKRPVFTTLYFHDVDTAGHKFGPKSEEVRDAIMKVDQSLKKLAEKLKTIRPDLNIIIVSDHGMTSVSPTKVVSLNNPQTKKFLGPFTAVGGGTIIHLYTTEKVNLERTVEKLNKYSKGYTCHLGKSIPKKLNYRGMAAIGNLVCLADKGYSIFMNKRDFAKLGAHGYTTEGNKDMHGILFAKGPSFKEVELPSKRNIHLYPLMAKILGLKFDHKIDGRLSELAELLK